MPLAALALVAGTLLGAELGAVQAGPTRVRFVASDTAQVFRLVDQLSGWSSGGPARFASAMPAKLGDADRKLLGRHAEIRDRAGWQLTHSAFIVEAPLDQACAGAVAARLLSAADAATECEVLHAFEERARGWAQTRAGQLGAAVQTFTVAGARLAGFAAAAARFSGSRLRSVDVYLVPSPEGADGAYTNGSIVLEVPPDASDDPLLHELWHAFAGPHLAAFQRAVQGHPRLDVETLGEGIAYAVQPGLFPSPDGQGALELTVGSAMRSGEPASLMGTNRPLELAVALRPSLARAWAGGSLEAWLPTAVAVYDGLAELDKAALATPRSLLLFGDSISPRLPLTVNTRRLDPELLKYPMLGAAIGIVLIGRGPEAVPAPFRERFFERWEDVEAKAGEASGTIEQLDRTPAVFLWWDRGAGGLDAGSAETKELRERLAARVRASMFRLVAAGVARAGRDGG